MTEAILTFEGVTPSALVTGAARLTQIGTGNVKAGKLLAAAAVLAGADVDDVINRTLIKGSAIRRVVSIVRNGQPTIEGHANVSAAKASKAMHSLDFAGLLSDDWATNYDAVIATAGVWDSLFAERSKPSTQAPKSLADLIINVSDALAEGVIAGRFTEAAATAALSDAAANFGDVVNAHLNPVEVAA